MIYGNDEERAALFAAMARMQADRGTSGVKKDAVNPHFRKGYATLAAVLEVGLPAAAKHGLGLAQVTRTVDGHLVLTTILTHEAGGYLSGDYPIRPVKDDPQGIKAAVTYAKRVGAEGALALAPDDDDDGELASGRGPQQQQRQTAPKRGASKPQSKPTPPAPPRPSPQPAQPKGDRVQEVRDEMQRLRARLGISVYRQLVGKEDPATLAQAEEALVRLQMAEELDAAAAPAGTQSSEAMKVLAEAREGPEKPWSKHDDGGHNA